MTISAGDTAPEFTLSDTDGNKVSLSDFRGKYSVTLVFFPFAFTATTGAATHDLTVASQSRRNWPPEY